MQLFRCFIVVIACMCSRYTAVAQPVTLGFRHYDVNDGLSQNSVWQTLQDRDGFMWFVTSSGLSKFDGEHFTTYKSALDDSNTLYSNHINSIVQGAGHELWIGGYAGVCRYNAITNEVERFFTLGKTVQVNYHLLGVFDNMLWVWVETKGIFCLNTGNGKIVKMIPMAAMQADSTDYCIKVIAANDHEFYIALLKSGLVKLNANTLKREQLAAIVFPPGDQPALLSFVDSILFFRAANKPGMLGGYDIRTKELYYRNIGNVTATGVCKRGDELLVSTNEDRIVRMKVKDRDLHAGPGKGTDVITLKGAIADLYADRSGVLWVGTDGMGIYKSVPGYRRFRHYVKPGDTQKLVKSIFSADSLIYTCAFGNYIDVYNRNGRFVRQIQSGGKTSFKSVVANARERAMAYWLAGVGCFGIYDLAKGSFTDYMPAITGLAPDVKTEPHFCALHKQGNGVVWAGFGNLLFQLSEGKNGQYGPKLFKTFGSDRITCITSGGGVVVVGLANKIQLYHTAGNSWDEHITLPADLVKCLLFQSDSVLWIGTENGLYRYAPYRKKMQKFDENSGLPNSFIYGLGRYGNHMWISTNKGLSRYSLEDGTFSNYTVEDGLQSNEFNTGAFHLSGDEQIYFGGPNGVNGFHDSDIKDNPFAPQVQFTGIRLFDEPLQTDTAYTHLLVITLPYNLNTLSFDFIGLEYSNDAANQYAYMMTGIDTGWIYTGNKHFARYAGLQPGSYRFVVKAANSNGVWQQPKGIVVLISAPYWQQGWFITISVLACIGLVFVVVYLIQRRQYRKKLMQIELQQKIQRERERISRDLHDNVGAQISYLVSNIDWINRHKIAEQEQQERLGNLSATAQSMMGNMRETIWALNKTAISLEELSDRLKVFVQQQLAYNDVMKFVWEERIANLYEFAPGEALHIFRICQEAVANAIKHSGGSLLTIKLTTPLAGGYEIQIADNGGGFDVNNKGVSGHYGLENMKLRAEESGANISILAEAGSGSKVIISRSN